MANEALLKFDEKQRHEWCQKGCGMNQKGLQGTEKARKVWRAVKSRAESEVEKCCRSMKERSCFISVFRINMLLLLFRCKQPLHVGVGKAQAQEDGRLNRVKGKSNPTTSFVLFIL